MKKYVAKILKTDFLKPDVKRFVLKKPSGYEFETGQATIISINEPKLIHHSRPFTFTSPGRADHLEFIIKIYAERNSMTRKLLEVKAGDEFILHAAFGTITFQGPGLFIAGGLGITPFIAIFRQLESEGRLSDNLLLYANTTARDIILSNELKEILGDNYINVLETTTDPNVERGFIGSKLLKQYVTRNTKHYYICGPDRFTIVVIKHLLDLGVEQSQIVYEESRIRCNLFKMINSNY